MPVRCLGLSLVVLCLASIVRAEPNDAGVSAAPSQGSLLSGADEILKSVTSIRGLPKKQPIRMSVMSRDQIGAMVRREGEKEYNPIEERVLKRLGLIPEQADFKKMVFDLLTEQLGGFYDGKSKQLCIADWTPLEAQRVVWAHEFTHALQDQNFDLEQLLKDEKNPDRRMAKRALAEGDGTQAMIEFQRHEGFLLTTMVVLEMSRMKSPVLDHVPAAIKADLLFPYLNGLEFVKALRQAALTRGRNQNAAVDDAFRNPPDSTEQILHPEKFLDRELPAKVDAPKIEGELERDVFGEFGWTRLFATRMPMTTAQRAAAGWGGDRSIVYGSIASESDPISIVNLSIWDTVTDAIEAEYAGLRLMSGLARAKVALSSGVFADAKSHLWSVERHGDQVLMIFGSPSKTRQAEIRDAVWKTWTVERASGFSISPVDLAEGLRKLEAHHFLIPKSLFDRFWRGNDFSYAAQIVSSIEKREANGVKLIGVVPDRLFARLELEKGDRIFRLNGIELRSRDDLNGLMLRAARTMKKFVLSVSRGEQSFDLIVDVVSPP